MTKKDRCDYVFRVQNVCDNIPVVAHLLSSIISSPGNLPPKTKKKSANGRGQEPITRSIQLPCVRATAFLQVGLFLDLLDLSVFPVKISVSGDGHIKYITFHKWTVGQSLADLNEFWCPYSLSACSYSISQILFLLKTIFPTIKCILITCCGISLHE